MLLRRITKHLKEQNWFAVGLDFLIVVVGVFMGFQVQQWNEDFSDKADAIKYLKRLSADMDISISRNNSIILRNQRQSNMLNLVLEVLDTCQLDPDKEPAFVAGLYFLGKYDMPVMVMGTIDELNSTGKFLLIGDIELRLLMTEAVRHYQGVLAVDPQLIARSMPSVNHVRSHVRFNLVEPSFNLREIDPDLVMYDFDEICADKQFDNAVAQVRETMFAITRFNQAVLNRQVVLQDAIKAKLNK